MKVSPELIDHIAKLARLALSSEEANRFSEEVGEVLGYIDSLGEVDTKDVLPTVHTVSVVNAFREDEVGDMFSPEMAVENAPEAEEGAFVVPRIIK